MAEEVPVIELKTTDFKSPTVNDSVEIICLKADTFRIWFYKIH